MAKVFTITEGLENLGAMKTGGQGSVYKGRRNGEVISAIKLLPTPVFNESNEDKNYVDFQNEVTKLKRVNEHPNPNVVKILSSGITESGNFPFIEMEYIEGPELEDLLKPPHDPVFTIKEALKVAEHLGNALAHCHRLDVRHGDIKSNNVKFNIHTANYILLDFGLSVMSDEQRRTSLRHAGAIEFMAPEQNEGQMLFQTDVYGFGVIMFELLAGQVPFPLKDKGETARNNVRLSHMETPPPDLLKIREKNLPVTWTEEKKHWEMQVPKWLLHLVYKCLEKQPENRFGNGIELHDYIVNNSTNSPLTNPTVVAETGQKVETHKISEEKDRLQQQILQYQQQLRLKDQELARLKTHVQQQPVAAPAASVVYEEPVKRGVSKSTFLVVLLITLALAGVAAYTYFKTNNANSTQSISSTDSSALLNNNEAADSSTINTSPLPVDTQTTPQLAEPLPKDLTITEAEQRVRDSVLKRLEENKKKQQAQDEENEDENQEETKPIKVEPYFKVVSKAYFYKEPNEESRRETYIVPDNSPMVKALKEEGDFIFVVFTDKTGNNTEGWLRKKDLSKVE